jgi:hypothetical protein
VVYVLSEKKIDMFLYIMLAMAVVFCLCINMPLGEQVSNARDISSAADSPVCSCGGEERANLTSYGYGPEDEAAYYLIDGGIGDDTGDRAGNDKGGGFGNDSGDRAGNDKGGGSGNNSGNRAGNDKGGGSGKDAGDGPGNDSGDAGDSGQHEDASSVWTEEDTGTKKHDISPRGWHLYIDLDLKQMYVYKDGEQIGTYEVSGGRPNSPSPLGTWKIISKDTWGEGFGGAWLGFNVPWGKYGIHGTTEPWAVGKSNNSKGCIRMRNKDVRELYKLVPYNTLVTIVYENIPFYPMRDGDVGSDVLAVERALKKLGYYHGSEDGVFGSSLKQAVLDFQKDNKLYATGVVNNSTYEKIMQQEKEYNEKQRQLEQEQEEERKRLEQELE